MADGVTIAQDAAQDGVVWDACSVCGANRRLDDRRLCHECRTDPLKVELASLRAELHCLTTERHVAEVGAKQKEHSRRARRDETLVALRERLAEIQQLADSRGRAEAELGRDVSRLERTVARAQSRNRELRTKLHAFHHLDEVHFALPLTEAEYLALVSVMVDVVAEDPDIPTLSIHRKLTED